MNVRRGRPGDEATLRAIRLEALAESPWAFASTLAREEGRAAEEWTRWLTESAVFLVESADGAQGLACGVRDRDDATSAYLMGMWVRPAVRGLGIADRLVDAVVRWARDEGYRTVLLDVAAGNDRARRLYERHGFELTGREHRLPETGVTDVEMRRDLARDPRGDDADEVAPR